MPSDDPIVIRYKFSFDDGRDYRFRVILDPITLTPTRLPKKSQPEWTRLEFHRCTDCPLDAKQHKYCPVAMRLHPIVDQLRDVVSTEQVKVTVVTPQRSVIRRSSAQDGISSLIGVTIATSGCPLTAFLRPMARFHLPFADFDETAYRAASTYMLAQYFRVTRGQQADLTLRGLHEKYDQVSEVNRRMAQRLRAVPREDGAINAIVILDMFAKGLPPQFDALLSDLSHAFSPFLDHMEDEVMAS